MMKFFFGIIIVLILYAYIGYPLAMAILTKFRAINTVSPKIIYPDISLVISAYNEEATIREKLDNVLSLNYPHDKIEIIVVSDASKDKTDDIVKGFFSKGVKLYRADKQGGKVAAYRMAISKIKSEFIVFSDATSILEKESLINLIANFNDPSVGCVGGLLKYVNLKKSTVGSGESKYWTYEKKIRLYESSLSSLTSVSGTLYAVRRKLYPIEMKDDLADDLMVPFNVKRLGFRTVLESKAICKEVTTLTVSEDMSKRVRITIQNIRGLINQWDIMNPFKYGLFSFLVISHKVFRLLVPIFLFLSFLLNAILASNSQLFLFIFMIQIVFYFGGYLGYLNSRNTKSKILNIIFYFCLSNLSIFIGIFKFLIGEKVITWEPIRN